MTTLSNERALRDIPIYKPGRPFLGAADGLRAEPLTFHIEPYRQFGSIYRMRRGMRMMVVLAGPEANEFIWQNTDLWNYPLRMRVFREGFDEYCLLQLDGAAHDQKKRHVVQGFKPSSFLPHLPAINQLMLERIDALPEGRHPDLRIFCDRLTGIMTSYALLQIPPPNDIDEKLTNLSNELLRSQWMGWFRYLWFLRRQYRELQSELKTLANHILDQREQNPPQNDDIMAALLNSRLKDTTQPTRQEVANDLLFLLQAGTQTASQLIVWGLMYLEQDQQWRKELQQELEQWNPANFSTLHQWPKLMATVLELERLRPSLPYFTLYPKADFVYQGVRIPKDTNILHPLTLPQFMAEFYDEPLCFKPQRFFGERRIPQRPVHGTFGGGRHACPGQTFARTKIALGLAAILTRYTVRFEGPLSFQPLLAATLTPNKEVAAQFVPRC